MRTRWWLPLRLPAGTVASRGDQSLSLVSSRIYERDFYSVAGGRCLRQDRSPVPSVIDPIGANPAKHDPAFGSTRSITNRLRPSSNIRHEGAGQRATPGLARGCGLAVVAWMSL